MNIKLSINDITDIDKHLRHLTNDDRKISKAKSFIISTHSIKWGGQVGQKIHVSSKLPWHIIQVRSRDKALQIFKSEKSNLIEDRVDEEMRSNEGYKDIELPVDELIRLYGNADYDHEFWPSVSTDIRGVLSEILLDKEGDYRSRWIFYTKGHYPCGYRSRSAIYVF